MGKVLSWHKAGQAVLCIKSSSLKRRLRAEIGPVVGQTYSIREVIPEDEYGPTTFRLGEIINRKREYVDGIKEVSFPSVWFRPVRETSIDCFRSLLNPSPDTVRKLEEVRP